MECDKNANEIRYINSFGDPKTTEGAYPKDSRLAKAYEVALDIRKFEIELYWKRSASFWLLVGGIAATLGLLLSGKMDANGTSMLSQRGKEIACFGLSLAGATISYAWTLVNSGSKFWQRNWEYQVGLLEQAVIGPLYKTVFAASKSKVMYSVSAINDKISSYICLLFVVATVVFLIGEDGRTILLRLFPSSINHGLLAFIIKFSIALANFLLVVMVINKVRNKRINESHDYNTEVEATVRNVVVSPKLFGTDSAKKIWVEHQGDDEKKTDELLTFITKNLHFSIKNRKKDNF